MLPLALLTLWTSVTTPPLRHVINLDYSTGNISVFTVSGQRATLEHRFTVVDPRFGSPGGLAARAGLIYTAVASSNGTPCAACFEVLGLDGALVAQVAAPRLLALSSAPDITDIAVDARGEVFLSDYGQRAAYYYVSGHSGYVGPSLVEIGAGAASVAVSPNGGLVYVQGNCGFGQAREYVREGSGGYVAHNCFGIGTIALIGGAADDAGDVFTPVDGVFGLVSISDAAGNGYTFSIPDPRGGIGGVALSPDASVAYVADHTREVIYAFARPPGGWLSGKKPKVVGKVTGFKALDVIAVLP